MYAVLFVDQDRNEQCTRRTSRMHAGSVVTADGPTNSGAVWSAYRTAGCSTDSATD